MSFPVIRSSSFPENLANEKKILWFLICSAPMIIKITYQMNWYGSSSHTGSMIEPFIIKVLCDILWCIKSNIPIKILGEKF